MSSTAASSRRSFLKGGALVAAPIAAVASTAAMAAESRLKRLEDEAAIRALHLGWLRQANAGEAVGLEHAIRSIAADHGGDPDVLDVAPGGLTATARYACAVELKTELARDCTLAQMAHAQGTGFVVSSERRILHARYVKADGVWKIAKVELL